MQSWIVDRTAPIDDGPLRRIERSDPAPAAGQLRISVSVAPICTWPKATYPRRGQASHPDTRSWVEWTR